MSGHVVCVLADKRSGSTLLTQLLGAHPDVVSVGEVHWFQAYVRNDRSLYNPPNDLVCACGSTFAECGFWRSVCSGIERPLDRLRLMPRFFGWVEPNVQQSLLKRLPRRLAGRYPDLTRSRLVQAIYDGKRVARDSMEVFDSIFRSTGARYIIDSSKETLRYRMLHDWYPQRIKMLVLHRDYKAVIYSKMKRGESLASSALSWKVTVQQIESLVGDVPSSNVISLKYEDLCTDPGEQLSRICRFLGLEFTESMLLRPESGLHDLGGSPSKFQQGRREIRLDADYQTEFSDAQRREMKRLVGSAAKWCGYE